MSGSSPREVWIVGLGARGALGTSAEAIGAAYRAGLARHAVHPTLTTRGGAPLLFARDPCLPLDGPTGPRLVEMVGDVAEQALAGAQERRAAPRIECVVALPAPRPGLRESVGDRVVAALRARLALRAEVGEIRAFAGGRTAGIAALAHAAGRIVSGAIDACVWCGVDSLLAPSTLAALEARDRLHADGMPYGFIPAEGAGACLLMAAEAAERTGRAPFGRLVGAALADEHARPEDGAVCLGRGLTAATREVLRGLAAGEKVHHVYADLNGERERVDEVGFTTTRVASRLDRAPCLILPATRLGETGAAFAPLAVGLAATAARRGRAEGSRVLLWTSGAGAPRGAALLHLPVTPARAG